MDRKSLSLFFFEALLKRTRGREKILLCFCVAAKRTRQLYFAYAYHPDINDKCHGEKKEKCYSLESSRVTENKTNTIK